jgi:exodeoxyribonuclease VII small subunit
VEVIVVARGGGSLADLFAFCDETLCRTVALLRVPVIASVGHHTDRTLIDDVAAVSCSTPTHAAEAAVPVDCADARASSTGLAARLEQQGRRAIVERARTLSRCHAPLRTTSPPPHAAAPASAGASRRREPRARRSASPAGRAGRRAGAPRGRDHLRSRPRSRTGPRRRRSPRPRRRDGPRAPRRRLERLRLALAAHDPQRTLERGLRPRRGPRAGPSPRRRGRRHAFLTLRLADGTVACAGGSRRERAGAHSSGTPGGGRSTAAFAIHERRRERSVPPPPTLFGPMPETSSTLTYETACARIEAIIRRLDSGESGLRETLELCQEGRRLVEFCARSWRRSAKASRSSGSTSSWRASRAAGPRPDDRRAAAA